MRLLVVEDHEDSYDGLVTYLQFCGFQVVGARNAESGLAAYCAEPVQAVLTDIELPGMSGCDLARAIRKLGDARLHIDAMSGNILPPQEHELFEHFFLKPLNLNSLSSTLLKYLG